MAGPQKVKLEIVPVEVEGSPGETSEPYRLLNDLTASTPEHTDLCEINFIIVWRYEVHPDVDGNVQAGWIIKLDDVRREQGQDVEIRLNREWWDHPNTQYEQKMYCLDDLLSQIKIKVHGESGDQVQDSKGRYVLRKVKHDVIVFSSVESRYPSGTNASMRKLLTVLSMKRRVEAGDRHNVQEALERDEEEGDGTDDTTILMN